MTAFSAVAKVTQAQYGSSSAAAALDTGRNSQTVAPIRNHSTTMSARARPYCPKPKKIGVHAAFRTSWAAYTVRAAVQPVRRHTSQPATAIIAYSTVHTGPNSHGGGAHDGCCSLSYSAAVPATPKPPIRAAAATAR